MGPTLDKASIYAPHVFLGLNLGANAGKGSVQEDMLSFAFEPFLWAQTCARSVLPACKVLARAPGMGT